MAEPDIQRRAQMADDDADLDAPAKDSPDGPAEDLSPEQRENFQTARKAFLDDDGTIRFIDSPDNWEKLVRFFYRYQPPLPITAPALLFAFDELSKENDLDLEQPPSEDEVAEALADHAAKQTERDEKPATISQAKQMAEVFRNKKRGEFSHSRNGRLVDRGGIGS